MRTFFGARHSWRQCAGADTRPGYTQRLERSGQRPITALVDISNYVMLEFGRPSHVFDLDKVQGGLTVRWGRAGERVELLNGQTVEVDPGVGVIADAGRRRGTGGHHGGREDCGVARYPQRVRRGRFLVARCDSRACAPLQLLD